MQRTSEPAYALLRLCCCCSDWIGLNHRNLMLTLGLQWRGVSGTSTILLAQPSAL